jgi:hypothetical protein
MENALRRARVELLKSLADRVSANRMPHELVREEHMTSTLAASPRPTRHRTESVVKLAGATLAF